MKKVSARINIYMALLLLLVAVTGCHHQRQEAIHHYHNLVNKAELAICEEDFRAALDNYGLAFRKIDRPFASDLYNASLAAQASAYWAERDQYLQQLIDGSKDIALIKATFLASFMTAQEWEILESHRVLHFDEELRTEMEEIANRDRLFRADYDNHDDTINTIRIKNLERLLELESQMGFPSHKEIGFSENQRRQPHHIVLHHTAQRRSYDKGVMDLEPMLRKAVSEGRLDPELAILYMKLQDDQDKGRYENYSTWQYRHPLLPDSMSSTIWAPNLESTERDEINSIRREWYADSIEDIETKVNYKENSSWPFLFTSISKSKANLLQDLTAEEAVEQYLLSTAEMKMLN